MKVSDDGDDIFEKVSDDAKDIQSRRIYWKPFFCVFLHSSCTCAPKMITFLVEELDRDF